ncbi:MAG TPA: DUF1800 domain-containing protein [Ilumatobacteraceae bacterium]|nr:DUF1800 domain-containing protein [Ilumatobacteraceae bacterium]
MPNAADIAHLLRRAGFGGTASQISSLTGQDWATTVDQLLDFSAAPADVEPAFLTDDNLGDWEKEFKLQAWWLDRMATTTSPLQEKLTLFWHGHFATANNKVGDARLMYLQNALFRSMAAGNFRDVVQQMSLQPAMLIWLDNDPNTKGHPNENFARELMELFILGVGQYTQDDVVASARAWTGHNTLDGDRTQYHFYVNRHDTGMKTFMGVTQNWDGPDIINFILRDDATRKNLAARFIAKKLWSFFAYPSPDDAIVATITDAFLTSDLSIAELVRAIFNHPAFLSDTAKQGLVRSPAEWVVACMRAVNLTAADLNPQWWMEDMGQQLFEPPNVSGWRQNKTWLTTSRLWTRANWTRYLIWRNNAGNKLSAITGLSVANAVQYGFDQLGIDNPSSHTRSNLETWLAAQRADTHAWTNWSFINLLTLVMLSPEMNLA